MSKVFISYGHSDIDFVQQLALALREIGHVVTLTDVTRSWMTRLASLSEAIQTGDAVILVISAESLNNKWLVSEFGTAVGYFQERGSPTVLPVLLDGVRVPVVLADIPSIHGVRSDSKSLVIQIAKTLGTSAGRQQAKQEEKREVQERIEQNAAEYISGSLNELKIKERRYQRSAYLWYFGALLGMMVSVGFASHQAITEGEKQASWPNVVHHSITSILLVGLLGALSRFAFVLGRSFMVESLRNGDRIHAISFGQFYLRAFGEKAEWSEIKEAFQHWNIDLGSSFSSQAASDIDPQLIQSSIEIAKSLSGKPKV